MLLSLNIFMSCALSNDKIKIIGVNNCCIYNHIYLLNFMVWLYMLNNALNLKKWEDL